MPRPSKAQWSHPPDISPSLYSGPFLDQIISLIDPKPSITRDHIAERLNVIAKRLNTLISLHTTPTGSEKRVSLMELSAHLFAAYEAFETLDRFTQKELEKVAAQEDALNEYLPEFSTAFTKIAFVKDQVRLMADYASQAAAAQKADRLSNPSREMDTYALEALRALWKECRIPVTKENGQVVHEPSGPQLLKLARLALKPVYEQHGEMPDLKGKSEQILPPPPKPKRR